MTDGITIDAPLRPGVSWRGRTASGVEVVLKRLPDDSLRDGRPHPAIAQRLHRLREIPLTCTANLLGVEQTGLGVVLVSEFIPGTPLADLPPAERSRHAAAVRNAVADLHRFGLVHGALHGGNVILDAAGDVRLIDPSPLLYDDVATDAADLASLFPDATRPTSVAAASHWHWRPLAAAAAVVLVAGAAAGAWAFHAAAAAR